MLEIFCWPYGKKDMGRPAAAPYLT